MRSDRLALLAGLLAVAHASHTLPHLARHALDRSGFALARRADLSKCKVVSSTVIDTKDAKPAVIDPASASSKQRKKPAAPRRRKKTKSKSKSSESSSSHTVTADPFSTAVGAVHSGGDLTFYAPGLGACGFTSTEDELIAAIPHELFDHFVPKTGIHAGNPNLASICRKRIRASLEGKHVDLTIVDRCAGCELLGSLDVTETAFAKLASPSLGRIKGQLTWTFLD